MHYYFYKITNLKNGKYYYGVHQTNNMEDEYMGSGIALKKSINKHGIENFKKGILKFFDNKNEMYLYERNIVNDDLVNDKMCYNLRRGGSGGHIKISFEKRSQMTKDIWNKKTEEEKEEVKLRLKLCRLKVKLKIKYDKEYSERIRFNSIKGANREKASINGRRYWDSKDSNFRKMHGEKTKNNILHKRAMQRIKDSGIFKGYNNPGFKEWKDYYEKNKDIIIDLLLYSSFTDKFIFKDILNMTIKMPRIINYYVNEGYVGKIDKIDRTPGFHASYGKRIVSKKTYFENSDIKNVYKFIYDDFFEKVNEFIEMLYDKDISDSMMYNNYFNKDCCKKYKGMMSYLLDLRLIKFVKKEKINIEKYCKNSSVLTSTKTFYRIDEKFKQDYFLIKGAKIYERYKIIINERNVSYTRI